MLTITLGANYPLDMSSANALYYGGVWYDPVHNATEIQALTYTGYTETLTGSFTYGTTVTGSITGINVVDPYGSLVINVTGFNVSVDSVLSANGSGNFTSFDQGLLNGQGVQITGSNLGDNLIGTQYADIFTPGGGNDIVVGENGGDTVIYSGSRSNYTFSVSSISTVIGEVPVITVTDTRSGSPDGTDVVGQVQNFKFSDGTITPGTIATGRSVSTSRFQVVNASQLFTAYDPMSLPGVKYQFIDNTSNLDSGYLMLDGVKQAAGTTVTAYSLSDITFQTESGTDSIQVRVNDGYNWSAWTTASVTAPTNHAVVIAPSAMSTVLPGSSVMVSSLFSASDADHDTILKYQFMDSAGIGQLKVNGVAIATGANSGAILPGDLGSVTFTTGAGTNTVQVRAFDGLDWGAWTNVSIVGGYIAPVVSSATGPTVVASHRQSFGFSDLFSSSSPQGLGITKYDFMDLTPGGGAIELNGVVQASGTDISVTAANLTSLSFVASGTDSLYARVYDGHNWSAYKKVTIAGPADLAPVLAIASLPTPRPGQTIDLSSLVSATDPDAGLGDTVTQYRIYDATPGGGTLRLNGVNQVNNSVYLAPGDLGSLTFTAGPVGTSDTLEIRAFDGLTWSSWKAVTVSGANLAPTVTASQGTAVSATRLESFGFSDLFTTADPQNASIVKYDFYDGTPGGGSIELNGMVQAAQTDIVVSASALSSLSFVASGTDVLYARVWDGYSWSTRTKVTITAPPNTAPGVSAFNSLVTTSLGSVLTVSDLFSATDADGDAITQYRIYDATPGGGTLKLGTVNEGNAQVYASPADLANLTFTAGKSDILYVRAFDGLAWSPTWQAITIKGTAVASPLAAPLPTLAPVLGPLAGLAAGTSSTAALEPIARHAFGFAAVS